MPFLLTIEFKAKIYSPNYPKAFNHIGDHIKAKRLELGLTREKTSYQVGVSLGSVMNWEAKVNERICIQHWPKVINFLGYCPYQPCATLHEKVAMVRKLNGFSIKQFADMIGIDEGTLSKFERGGSIYHHLAERVEKYYQETIMC